MRPHQEIDIYETILQEEQKDRLSFWALNAALLLCISLVIVAFI